MSVQVIKQANPDGSTSDKPIRVKIKSTVDLKADNVVAVYNQMRKAQKLIKAYDEDKKFLVDYVDKIADADDEVIITADGGSVRMSKRGMNQTVKDIAKLHQKLGDDVFYGLVSISLEDLKRYMTGQDMEDFIETTQTGPRRVYVTLNNTAG